MRRLCECEARSASFDEAYNHPFHGCLLLDCAVREVDVFGSELWVGKVMIALDSATNVLGAKPRPCPTCAVRWGDQLDKTRSMQQHEMVHDVELREELVGPFPTLGVASVVIGHDGSN